MLFIVWNKELNYIELIFLFKFSSNINPKFLVIIAFSNFSGDCVDGIWSDSLIRQFGKSAPAT